MTSSITHYCPSGDTLELDATWDDKSKELRARCENCGSVYANANGLEHE